jgi:peptide/nickel transport system substrate-binding protein
MKQRIVLVACLSVAISMSMAFTAMGTEYNESPMLKVKVAAGELPVVQERLPVEPQIVEPIEKIGEYGGRLTVHSSWPNSIGDGRAGLGYEGLLRIGRDLKSSVPNIAVRWLPIYRG